MRRQWVRPGHKRNGRLVRRRRGALASAGPRRGTSESAAVGAEDEARANAGTCTCALEALAQCLRTTRLETRTKESNMRASQRVANPWAKAT